MKKTAILTLLTCSIAFSAYSAMGEGYGAKASTKQKTTSKMATQAKEQAQTRTREQLLDQAKLDLQLRDRIQDQLRTMLKDYDQTRLMIMSHDGEVTLQGIARNREQARMMEQEVKRVQGVNRVQNNLAVEVE